MAVSAIVKEFFGSIKGIITNSAGKEVDVQGEDDGSLKTVLYGKDADANQDALKTNAAKQLQVEVIGVGANSSVAILFSLVLLELRLANLHLGQISGLSEATINDVEE